MTNEEFERLKDLLRATQLHTQPDDVDLERAAAAAQTATERRKLDRDMNRLERVLRKVAGAPKKEDDARWNQFKESSEKRQAEIKEFAARSDAKVKALAEEMQRRNPRQS